MTFEKGQSGNPSGRPYGIKDRRTLFSEMIMPHKEELLKKAIEMALNGNEQMLRLLLSRLLPAKPTSNTISFTLPNYDMKTPEDIVNVGKSIINAVSNNEITPDDAKSIMGIIESQRKNLETHILEQRLSEIEKALKPR